MTLRSVSARSETLAISMTTLAAAAAARPRLTTFNLAMLSLFWFGVGMHWTVILITNLPAQANLIGGEAVKGQTLGLVLLVGAGVSMVVAPVFGALSDRFVTPFGRRRPWIVVGTVMNVVGLLGLAYFPKPNDLSSLPLYILAFMWVEFWNNVATAPYSALIPDVVPPEQRGSASGWYGLMSIFGTFVGALAPFVFTRSGVTNITALYYFVGVVLVLCMLGTVLFVREPRVTRKPPPFVLPDFLRGLISPLRAHDFRWVFLTRFLMVMGVYTIQEFLQFFMGDVIKAFTLFGTAIASNAATAASVFLLMLLVGALPSSIAAGYLSDRLGRKAMVYFSSVLQAIPPLAFVLLAPSFELATLMGLVFGLGYGAYQSVDWALAADVLPSQEDYAKDMGVWHVALTLPQVIATPIAGFLLDNFQVVGRTRGIANLGYDVIFSLAVVYFILGTVLVRQIRQVR